MKPTAREFIQITVLAVSAVAVGVLAKIAIALATS